MIARKAVSRLPLRFAYKTLAPRALVVVFVELEVGDYSEPTALK